ncbi:hypothetical protein DCC85_12130 [Paenibacillus sp. CAA11]|uniref:putative amidoligase domain-containing protein n=1 Tax=Paenibacillus sp. CAA11 TaxID=1532905 RepID=UPI000D3C7C33|nr:hypothetical protein [Paenibacillus sp. CAA11]AWB44894.1 hypothetical protein DCC85_12130 [Paenibacillus sp. CAA11]
MQKQRNKWDWIPAREIRNWEERLRMAGIKHQFSHKGAFDMDANTRYAKGYKVYVTQLRSIGIVEESGGRSGSPLLLSRQSWEGKTGEKIAKRLEKLAVRTLYSLGMDSGIVTILPGEERGSAVAGIKPLDKGWQEDAARYVRANSAGLAAASEDEIQTQQVRVGLDPEFILFDPKSGKVIPASRFLGRQGRAGCDAVWIRGKCYYPVAELRPAPATHPSALFRQLRASMALAAREIEDTSLHWYAGGMPLEGLPLGGHVHLSGVPFSPELLRALDNYLALLVAVLEDSRSLKRRPRYGFLGDFRLQPHGGFEYRTLPSFLVSPMVTKAVIALAFLIANQYGKLKQRPLQDIHIQKAFYQGEREKLRTAVLPLLQELETLDECEQHAAYIRPMFAAVRDGWVWDELTDVRPPWRIHIPEGKRKSITSASNFFLV